MTTHYASSLTEKQRIAELICKSDKPLAVEIEEGDIRTIKQNARYWAGVVTATQNQVERDLGVKYSKEAIHDMFKTERFGKKSAAINGKVYERCARSSKMTTKQFAKFAEWSENYAISELGVDPAEIDFHARGSDL